MISLLNEAIDGLVTLLAKTGLLKKDLDYKLLRASMVIIFLLFGYQKWFIYEAKVLIPYIGNDPFLSWMYPVFGIQGASWLVARRLRVDFRRASVKPAGYTARFPHRLRLRAGRRLPPPRPRRAAGGRGPRALVHAELSVRHANGRCDPTETTRQVSPTDEPIHERQGCPRRGWNRQHRRCFRQALR
jgi:hypothetical protein